MARLDRVKNLSGLVEWYGKNTRLRELVNLVVVGGDRRKESQDNEEKAEMKKMYDLIEEYELNGQFRWISSQMNRVRNGELYRYICDTKGAFVQPALYEAFGLTVIASSPTYPLNGEDAIINDTETDLLFVWSEASFHLCLDDYKGSRKQH